MRENDLPPWFSRMRIFGVPPFLLRYKLFLYFTISRKEESSESLKIYDYGELSQLQGTPMKSAKGPQDGMEFLFQF